MDLEHDALGRTTKVTYPDDTFEQATYEKLHVKEQRDRLGRVTTFFHDGAGRPTAVRDAAGRTVQYDWCRCADLNALIDAKGQRTTWTRDVHGRVTTETRADGTTATGYTYQPLTGRLATVTDPKTQVTTYTYNLDDSLASTGFTNETIATADLSHTYDTQYARPTTMVDGNVKAVLNGFGVPPHEGDEAAEPHAERSVAPHGRQSRPPHEARQRLALENAVF